MMTPTSTPPPRSPAEQQSSESVRGSPGDSNNSLNDHKSGLQGSEKEFELLQPHSSGTISPKSQLNPSINHDHLTTPLMTRGALLATDFTRNGAQYGVLGRLISIHANDVVEKSDPDDDRIYINANAPFSALVCGVQGSGKSHTVSAILESMTIADERIGSLSKSLCVLVLHMSEGGKQSSPNEAAWVGMSKYPSIKVPNVVIYVSPSQFNTMKTVYSRMGMGNNVQPLHFLEEELDAQAFLSMMAVGKSGSAPLYVQIILSILRDLGETFTYKAFKEVLEKKRESFNSNQKAGLEQRLYLLESFMTKKSKAAKPARFSAGQITIVDLSDPFIDSITACGIFEVVTRMFVRAKVDTGKIIVVDEAHKYLSANTGLTNALLTLIREQRHKGIRVVVSTQEPTIVPPVLIDLCSIAIMHRFSSPSWWEHIKKHVSADLSCTDAYDRIVKLRVGEAIVFAPSGIFVRTIGNNRVVEQYGRRYLTICTRQRITKDGGSSVMVI
ncbi:P-loop containing nucleoside triphosphate hydrolase protein [Phellopilus nigrolimitatus]|nr:P-loop containing nucleoside triphosphate hydrolase protein [Phellopilus nigrolimitatus]